MTAGIEELFPADLPDPAAVALSQFLHDLAAAGESHYYHQLTRYHRTRQLDLFDPERPWLRRPPDDPDLR
jgi:hypothetical protein